MARKFLLPLLSLLALLAFAGTAMAASADTGDPGISHAFWYLSRASGLTAYLLLTLTVCFGLLVRTRLMDWLVARWRSFDLHQFTALLALAFIALHIFSLLGDQYIGFDLGSLLIPFASPYRPFWTALGVVGLYLALIATGSFYVRRFIGYRAWRAIHYVTFGVFLLATAHGLFSGTDSGQLWDIGLYWLSSMLVAGLTIWRFTSADRAGQGSSDLRPVDERAPRPRELEPTLR